MGWFSSINRYRMQVAFTTEFGLMLWGDATHLPRLFRDEVSALITSPPYLLRNPKEYGGQSKERAYLDEFLGWAEGWLEMLTDDGSIVINLGDAFNSGGYSQSLYKERLLIELEEKLGLHLVQRFEWWSPNRMPNPIDPVCVRRTHCVPSLESFFWLSPHPHRTKADNRRVLVEYSQSLRRMLDKGNRKSAVRIRPSGNVIRDESFLKDNGGAIPHNILCAFPEGSNTEYMRYCRENGLPIHPARFPMELPNFFIRFLTTEEDLVMDPFGGSATTGLAAERAGRRWVASEKILEYIKGAAGRFEQVQWQFCA